MRLVFGNNNVCITLDKRFVEACEKKEELKQISTQFTIKWVLSVTIAWKMHISRQVYNHPKFSWWEAAEVAHEYQNKQLLTSLHDYVVNNHLSVQYNSRIIWTRMEYLLTGSNNFARHCPEEFYDIDELSPIIGNPRLADFGQKLAQRYGEALSTRCQSSRELATRAARVNIVSDSIECVTLYVGTTAFTCIAPPHADCAAAAKLVRDPVNLTSLPQWFISELKQNENNLDALEDELDRAIGVQQRLRSTAEVIIEGLGEFCATEHELKTRVVDFMTTRIQAHNTQVSEYEAAVEWQQKHLNELHDIMDWFVRETDEIKTFCAWKTKCKAFDMDGSDDCT